jgi:hypothetical protein
MPVLRIIDGGKDTAPPNFNPIDKYTEIDDINFSPPPNLYIGLLTSLLGAAAGLISLVLFFGFQQPELYVSPEWLVFIAIGGLFGFYLRLEQPITQYFRATRPNRR